MSNLHEEIARFRSALEFTPGLWKSLDVRCIALKRGESNHNILTIVRIDHPELSPTESGPEIYADTDSILALRTRLPFGDLWPLLDAVMTGTLPLANHSVRYVTNLRGENLIPYSYGWSRVAGVPPDRWTSAASIAHELTITGESFENVMDSTPGRREQLDQELRAATVPWDGFDALLKHGIRTQFDLIGQATRLLVHAGLDVQILLDNTRLSEGTLEVEVQSGNHELPRYCSVGYVSSLSRSIGARGSIPATPSAWKQSSNGLAWLANAEVGRAESVSVFVRVGPYVADRATIIDDRLRVQRPLVRVYRTIDPEMTLLTESLLSPRRNEQIEFERAVARVLLFCGFAVDSYAGDRRLGDAVDLVAYSQTNRILLVVECTTGPLQSKDGKLSRLVIRGNTIRSTQAEYGAEIMETILVIATPLSASEISQSDRVAASADQITVLHNQALSSLLAAARSGAGVDDALRLIRRHASLNAQNFNQPDLLPYLPL